MNQTDTPNIRVSLKYMIKKATDNEMNDIRSLFLEYQAWLGYDLCFQDFQKELDSLPGCYSEPTGTLLVAIVDSKIVGCVGIRKIGERLAELKRLFVKDEFKGYGLGKELCLAAIEHAHAVGYESIMLDTLPNMTIAKKLYKKLGFVKTDPYYKNPIAGVEYYQLRL